LAHNQIMSSEADPSNISRRRWVAASGALTAGSVFGALEGCQAWADKPIRVAAHVWVGYEPLFMARDRSWLDGKLVTLQETRSALESMAALRANTVQAAALTLDEVLGARASGLDLSVVLVFNISMGADMLVARPGITQLEQLKGLRVGYEASSVAEVMLAEVLKQAGLTRQQVNLVKLLVPDQLAAWQQNAVDAVITYEPVATQLQNYGMTRLFDSRQMPDTIIDVLAVRQEALGSAYTKSLKHLVAAHFRALDHLMRNPQDAAYRMAQHLSLPANQVLLAFKGLALPTAENNYRLLAGPSPELLRRARRVQEILQRSGLITQNDDLAGFVSASFLPTEGVLP
jgi:NitT/TauT family transport system substrate-binding protein